MTFKCFLVFSLLILGICGQNLNPRKFPKDFLLGTASASYQIEGAWNEDGKGENIWDRVSHQIPSPIVNGDTGDIACDSYHKYKEDISLLKELGATVYRFSISWSRILPTGYNTTINQAGIEYYRNLIQELRENDIEPLVTIYHWDLPQPLQDEFGGWLDEKIIGLYVDYVRIVFENFGHEVKFWLTFNEPKQTCLQGYGNAQKAPLINMSGHGEYICTHNLLKAHAEAWHLYNDYYRTRQLGFVGITIDTAWMEPETETQLDLDAAERVQQFNFGWFANPIFNGDYPLLMKEFIEKRSLIQGFNQSRLPTFTQQQIDRIKGSSDFLGLNFYTSCMVVNVIDNEKDVISWEADMEANLYQKEEWPATASSWLRVTPWGLPKLLHWVNNTYGDIKIMITENGYSDNGTTLYDNERVQYYQDHLSGVRDALDDGINIFGYTAWSLMDNFEWMQGYSERFGIYSVDFNDPERPRTPKLSVDFFKKFFTTRCLVEAENCIEA